MLLKVTARPFSSRTSSFERARIISPEGISRGLARGIGGTARREEERRFALVMVSASHTYERCIGMPIAPVVYEIRISPNSLLASKNRHDVGGSEPPSSNFPREPPTDEHPYPSY